MRIKSSSSDASNMLAERSTLVPAQGIATVAHEGRTVLLEPGSGRYFGLSDVGTRTWELIQQRLSPLEIVSRLESEYDVEHGRVAGDVAALLSALLGARLIRWE